MSTQEERLAALEKNVTDLRQRTATAITEIEENTTILLNNFSRRTLVEWGKRGIDIATIDACAGTEDGERILKRAGFKYTGKRDEREMYHFDIDESNLKILQPYKTALAQWREQHHP